MGTVPRGLLIGVCAVLTAIATADASFGEAANSVVVGQAKCADCTRKNMKAEAVFKGLQVTIKCKNGNGEYESKAVGELDGSGAFAVPLAADLRSADCLAQLHSAAGAPCPVKEPSRIVPTADGNFVAVAGKAQYLSAECASVTIMHDHKKHLFEHFHKGHGQEHHDLSDHFHKGHDHDLSDHFHKGHDHEHHHFFDHFHKEPTPSYGGSTTPIYHPPSHY